MSKKTIFFDDYCGYQISVIVENGKITEFDFEKRNNTSVIGNIYKGRVEKILPGMNSALSTAGSNATAIFPPTTFPSTNRATTAEAKIPFSPTLKRATKSQYR